MTYADIVKKVADSVKNVVEDFDIIFSREAVHPTKDSVCFSTTFNPSFNETMSDVTGLFIKGNLNFTLLYRKYNTNVSVDETCIETLSNITERLHDKLMSLTTPDYSCIITEFSVTRSPNLTKVFADGVKDYSVYYTLRYERKI